MINVYRGVKKYDLGEPWVAAAAALATHPASGEFMKRGQYDIVTLPPNYSFPPELLSFTTDDAVFVAVGENYARFQHNGTEHVFWRVESLQEQK